MPTTFLVTPIKKNALVEEEIFKKGKQTFSVIKTWNKGVLISDSIPKSKIINGTKQTIFKEFNFKENRFDYKKKLVLTDDISDKDSKSIKKLFKLNSLNSWNLDEYGWKFLKSKFILHGDFDFLSVPIHKLTLFSSENELQIIFLSKEQVDNYSKNGLPKSLLYELSDSTEVCAPIFDDLTLLTVNDEEIPDFFTKFKQKYDLALKEENLPAHNKRKKVKSEELKYALIYEGWIKRSWYDLTIYEDFDFSKIKIYISRDNVFGSNSFYETFSMTYGELDFEFRENFGANSSDIYIVDSNGKHTNFEIINDDEDEYEDEDEVYEEDEE